MELLSSIYIFEIVTAICISSDWKDTLQALYEACQPVNNEETRAVVCQCLSAIVQSYKPLEYTQTDVAL